jgi:hypothetical protein
MGQLSPVPFLAFHSLSQTFGPIVRTVLGLNSFVIFSRYEDIKEVFNNEELDDRIPNFVGNLAIFGDNASPALSFFGSSSVVDKIDSRVRWRELR